MFVYALYMFKDRLYMFVYMYICIVYVWMLKTHCICSLYLFVCCYTKESSDNTIEANKCTKHKVQDIYIIHTRSNQAQHTYAKQTQYKNNIVIKLNWNKNNNQKSKHAVQICFKEYKYCDPNIVIQMWIVKCGYCNNNILPKKTVKKFIFGRHKGV